MNDRDKKIQALNVLTELKRRHSYAPLRYIEWHPGQQRAIDLKKQKRGLLLNSGNRWGKTRLNGGMSVAHSYGYWIWDVPDLKLTDDGDYPPRVDIHPDHWIRRPDGVPIRVPNTGLLVTGLARERGIGGILFPAVEECLPPAVRQRWQVLRGAFSVPNRYVLPNGSEVYMGSGEQDPMQYEGMHYDWVGCDEPPPRVIWGPIWRGMTDFFAPFWWTMTPIGRNAPFAYELFIKTERNDVAHMQGSIWDNPYISHEAKRAFLEEGDHTEEERQARESGAWSFMSHRAFPTFDPAAHVIPPFRPPLSWPRMLVIDPAHRRPYAMVWMAFGPDGEVHIYDEWPHGQDHAKMRSSPNTVADYATIIRNREGGDEAHYRVLDPRFGPAEYSFKGGKFTSVQEDFAGLGLYFDCNVPDTGREEVGIQRVRELLRYDRTAPLSPLNRPKLQVSSACQNVIDAMTLSNFVPHAARDNLVLPEKLQELYKDFRDCVRYGILYDRPWIGDGDTSFGPKENDFALANDLYAG